MNELIILFFYEKKKHDNPTINDVAKQIFGLDKKRESERHVVCFADRITNYDCTKIARSIQFCLILSVVRQ